MTTTEVVKEFPELQGIMGSYYAKRDKNNNTICKALYEQYKPLDRMIIYLPLI